MRNIQDMAREDGAENTAEGMLLRNIYRTCCLNGMGLRQRCKRRTKRDAEDCLMSAYMPSQKVDLQHDMMTCDSFSEVKEKAFELTVFASSDRFSTLILLHALEIKASKDVERMLLVKDIKNRVMSQIQFPICCFARSIVLFALNLNENVIFGDVRQRVVLAPGRQPCPSPPASRACSWVSRLGAVCPDWHDLTVDTGRPHRWEVSCSGIGTSTLDSADDNLWTGVSFQHQFSLLNNLSDTLEQREEQELVPVVERSLSPSLSSVDMRMTSSPSSIPRRDDFYQHESGENFRSQLGYDPQILQMLKEEHQIILENQKSFGLYVQEKRDGLKRRQQLEEELLRAKIEVEKLKAIRLRHDLPEYNSL
ncbi:hypothetical protein MG293_017058 [Ovis ammon polii]|uniref:Fibrinogen silencer-binding protein n=1 Tax=Ovis ammon polii TaxID=230172 RepID=A0AAD4TUN8_OVIAM|nr:hypothetical protein MG293_017058 [Ovis ammon polii]